MTKNNYEKALAELEREHLQSQPSAWPHLVVHWKMFALALRSKDFKEALGQIPRMVLAVPGSVLGLAPSGNVGTTKMGIFEKRS